jgi:hypothetical protein
VVAAPICAQNPHRHAGRSLRNNVAALTGGTMARIAVTCTSVVLALCASGIALADGYGDLIKAQAPFVGAKSGHAEQHLANGRKMSIDLSAPDRWRLQPSPVIDQLTLGDETYTVREDNATKLPVDGEMIRKMISNVAFSVQDAIKASAHDRGTQTLDGKIVHAYSYAVHGVPFTLYVRGNSQPVQSLESDTRGTTVTGCSIFNASIAIAAP